MAYYRGTRDYKPMISPVMAASTASERGAQGFCYAFVFLYCTIRIRIRGAGAQGYCYAFVFLSASRSTAPIVIGDANTSDDGMEECVGKSRRPRAYQVRSAKSVVLVYRH